MIFVDTNVFIYAVGSEHPLRDRARLFFADAGARATRLCTSAEVLQEMVHIYLLEGRVQALDRALSLVERFAVTVWPLEAADVALARSLHGQHPSLTARDLCHLTSCRRRGVSEMMTFDRALAAAGSQRSRGPG